MIGVLLLTLAASAMDIAPPDSATRMGSLYAVKISGVDWLATGAYRISPALVNYNSSGMAPVFYHLDGAMHTWSSSMRVFDNESSDAKTLALAYLANGTICNKSSGLLNATAGYAPSSCYLMVNRDNGNWVDWEGDIAFQVWLGGEIPACELGKLPFSYHIRLLLNTIRWSLNIVPGLGVVFDVIVTVMQAAFYFVLLGVLVSAVTVIPKVFR